MDDKVVACWGVFNNDARLVASFPFSKQTEAYECATELTAKRHITHYGNLVKERVRNEVKTRQEVPQPDFPPLVLDRQSAGDNATFLDVSQRIDAVLAERGFKAGGAEPLTRTWDRNPETDQEFWAKWPGPRWVLAAAQ